jgi:hypothetical protein
MSHSLVKLLLFTSFYLVLFRDGCESISRTRVLEVQSQEHAHHLLWHQADCSRRIRSGRRNSQVRILLWRLAAIVRKCAKTSIRTLAKESAGCCVTTTRRLTLPFSQGNLWNRPKLLSFSTHLTRLTWPFAAILCFLDWRQGRKVIIVIQLRW